MTPRSPNTRAVAGWVALLSVAASAHAVSAELLVSVGTHPLLPNTPDQQIPIFVSGGSAVEGLNLNLQLEDGGPELGGLQPAPRITAVDLTTATIFSGNIFGGAPVDPGSFPQLAIRSLLTDSGTVAASGLLATITLDTTGFFVGQWSLSLTGTLNGDSNFLDIPATFTNGSLTITRATVPEPAASLCVVAALAALARRRPRR